MNNLVAVSPATIKESNQIYTSQNPYPQQFSIPYPIIKYIIQNPKSGKVWKKLIQTCKYFYSKNHVLPVKDVYWGSIKRFNGSFYCYCCTDNERFDRFVAPPKLWITNSLKAMVPAPSNIVSLIVPKIDKCDIRKLTIMFQNLSWNDYQKLTSSGTIEELMSTGSTIKRSDDTYVTADKLLENLQNLKLFHLGCSKNSEMFQADTVKKMVQHISNNKKLHYFKLHEIPENLDFLAFKNFLLKNESVRLDLFFVSSLPDSFNEIYKNIKEAKKNNPLLKVPDIRVEQFYEMF